MSYPEMSTDVPWSLVKSGFKKSPVFRTDVQEATAGRGNSAVSYNPFARWAFALDLSYISGAENQESVLQDFLSCFLECNGRAGRFLFTDPNDNRVEQTEGILMNVTAGAAVPFGMVGDGSSTQFRFGRRIGRARDLLQNVTGYQVYVNGTLTDVTVSDTGVVIFSTAPADGAMLSWDGDFRYLCRFSDDRVSDLARVNKNADGFLWSATVSFESEFA
jgi:hypothetical protein